MIQSLGHGSIWLFAKLLQAIKLRQRIVCISNQSNNAQVKSAQNLTVLIRDLQELWLFGGLDTLMDLGDEEANKAKVLNIAAMVETLAKLNLPKIEKKTLEQGQAEER